MKFKIDNNIELYKIITKIYEDSVIRDLEAAEKDLVNIFEEILNNEAENFNLSTKSSINNVEYYSVKSRVKKAKSFAEKLVRKDIGITLLKEFGAEQVKILQNKATLMNKLKKLDDIVGLRIVTELREDTFNVYKLLENNISSFLEKNIIFHDIKQQPQIMKNGLSIFRIKGEYDNIISFELQIKSKIDEAWGEMDHTIFYKDHSSSLIKPTIQVTMNNVGIILEKLETLLYGLRHSSQVFEANSKYIEFENNLYKNYNANITKVFEQPIPLAEISKIVYFFKEQKNIECEITQVLNFDFLTYDVNDLFTKKLLELFHSSHNLIIIEAFYHSALCTEQTDFEITATNYENIFNEYVNEYVKYLNNTIDKEGDFIITDFYNILKSNYNYINSNEVILNQKKIEEYMDVYSLVINTFDDDEDKRKEIISNMFFIVYFAGNIELYYKKIKNDIDFSLITYIDNIVAQSENYPENNFIAVVNKLAFSLKKVIQK